MAERTLFWAVAPCKEKPSRRAFFLLWGNWALCCWSPLPVQTEGEFLGLQWEEHSPGQLPLARSSSPGRYFHAGVKQVCLPSSCGRKWQGPVNPPPHFSTLLKHICSSGQVPGGQRNCAWGWGCMYLICLGHREAWHQPCVSHNHYATIGL